MGNKIILMLARCTQPNLIKTAISKEKTQLLTIPYSHYCEFGRWSLDANKIPYDHHGYAPGGHVLPTLNLRICGETKYFASSSRVTKVSKDTNIDNNNTEDEKKKLLNKDTKKPSKPNPTSVPACVLPDGSVLPDSWSIARAFFKPPSYSKQMKKDQEKLVKILDFQLGPQVRQMFYAVIFKASNYNLWNKLCTDNSGFIFRTLWNIGFGNLLTKRMIKLFQSDNKYQVDLCKDKCYECCERISKEFLPDDENLYLFGKDKPGMEDYALASLASGLVCPDLYCNGDYSNFFDSLLEQDKEYYAFVMKYRKHRVGKFCMMMYEKHRAV